MHRKDPWPGATPGTRGPNLTREPLGTEGELTPGPDALRPSVPEERRELEEMGVLPTADEDERDAGLTPLLDFGPPLDTPDRADELEDDITDASLMRIL